MGRIASRRDFLRKTAALTGGAVAASAGAAPLAVPPSAQEPGRPIPEAMYGMPAKYEAHVARRRSDVLKNRQNWSDPSIRGNESATPTGSARDRPSRTPAAASPCRGAQAGA